MKHVNTLIIAALLLVTSSCKKDKPAGTPVHDPVDTVVIPIPSPVGDTVDIPLDDTARVLLKDVLSTGLPSPYYHFVYDADHYVTQISFASNFDIYDLTYQDRRLVKMVNTNHGSVMNYTYNNEKVVLITELSATGLKRWEYRFDYNGLNQLIQIRWIEFFNGVDASPFKKVILSYRPDGNLAKAERFFRETSGQLEWTSTTEYKDYDNTVNVDDFSMNKDFFESLLFLPRVKLQKNNHHTEITLGAQNDYKTTYTYQFSNGLPIVENGTMLQTRGSNAGQSFSFTNQFSYY